MTIDAYAAMEAKAKLQPFKYDPEDFGPEDVEVSITHCGICHSDIHLIDNDWQVSNYPFVPGHEIIGTVTSLGRNVKGLSKGDRVGIGWQANSCGTCEWCIQGDENFCAEQQPTCVGRNGGFANKIIVDGRFAFRIPDELTSENAAPLLCAGITVYSPLRQFGVKPPMRVGVVGIGGLGHVALQFANKFGCRVTAFSSSPDKESEARSFGAHEFVNSRDENALEQYAGSQDVILNTVNVDLDWTKYLDLLRPKGKLCFLGVPPSPMQMHAMSLVAGQKTVCGSPIGGRTLMNEMFAFAARHAIEAKTEVLPLSKVNDAIQKVRDNKARYRMVLKV